MQIVIVEMDAVISIHALLAESDARRESRQQPAGEISIHALLAESDRSRLLLSLGLGLFLSTLSLRRATTGKHLKVIQIDISIHALLAESDNHASNCTSSQCISIHALLAESDLPMASFC